MLLPVVNDSSCMTTVCLRLHQGPKKHIMYITGLGFRVCLVHSIGHSANVCSLPNVAAQRSAKTEHSTIRESLSSVEQETLNKGVVTGNVARQHLFFSFC